VYPHGETFYNSQLPRDTRPASARVDAAAVSILILSDSAAKGQLARTLTRIGRNGTVDKSHRMLPPAQGQLYEEINPKEIG
jgi:hypothetical protein